MSTINFSGNHLLRRGGSELAMVRGLPVGLAEGSDVALKEGWSTDNR